MTPHPWIGIASRPAHRQPPPSAHPPINPNPWPLRAQVKTQAVSDTILVISGATAASLALGRFVLLPVQRGFSEKAGPPKQNGVPYPEAGDA